MTIEHAHARLVPKPWGIVDLHPWNSAHLDGGAIGEIWFERCNTPIENSSLLLKLLFTSQTLSIQVHPDDSFAHSIGLPNGKTEAWYVLSAAPEAKVALGLKQRLTSRQLREAVDDGSISNIIAWQPVTSGTAIFIPAGTIHAIGAGLIIAEIQQRSDTTFRLFDYGRKRELHVDNAISVANVEPAEFRAQPVRLTDERTLLVSNPHFVFERINLAAGTAWHLEAERETWLLVVDGGAHAGKFRLAKGDALFVQSDRIEIIPGPAGMVALIAYTGGDWIPNLLQRFTQRGSKVAATTPQAIASTSIPQIVVLPANSSVEIIK